MLTSCFPPPCVSKFCSRVGRVARRIVNFANFRFPEIAVEHPDFVELGEMSRRSQHFCWPVRCRPFTLYMYGFL
jgi:hypothetical protein